MTTTDNYEAVETLLEQMIDVDGDPDMAGMPDDEVISGLAERLPEGEWGDRESHLILEALEAHRAEHRAAADLVRESCQMTGRAMVGNITVRPNPEFICQSGPTEVRARQLRDWPTSPAWYVSLEDPEGDGETYTGNDLGSWGAVLATARERDAEWAEAQKQRARAKRKRFTDALAARLEAQKALEAAHAEVEAAAIALDGDTPDDQSNDVPVMSAAEFATYRHRMGLTLEGLAGLLRNQAGRPVNPRTVRAWEAGRDPVGQAIADQIMVLDAKHADLAAELAESDETVQIDRFSVDRGWMVAAVARAWETRPGLRAEWAYGLDSWTLSPHLRG